MPCSEVDITINDRTCSDRSHSLALHPGLPNHLQLTWRPRAQVGQCRAVLEIQAPDGRQCTVEQVCRAGRPVSFGLGRFAVPAVYAFEAGVVYRRGYRLRLTLERMDNGTRLHCHEWYEGLSRVNGTAFLHPGQTEWVVFNDGYIPAYDDPEFASAADQPPSPHMLKWYPFGPGGGAMDPPIELRMAPQVLVDPDDVVVLVRLHPDTPHLPDIPANLVVVDGDDRPMCVPISLTVTHRWQEQALLVSGWPPGDYRIELRPRHGTSDEDGPMLSYRRRPLADHIQVSPLAPFVLQRDPTRDRFVLDKWHEINVRGWHCQQVDGRPALLEIGDDAAQAVSLDLPLGGPVAIFGLAHGHFFLRKASDGLTRPVSPYLQDDLGPVFITTADLSTDQMTILPGGTAQTGVRELHFLPVTQASTEAFQHTVQNPPVPLRAVADWWCASDCRPSEWLGATGKGFRSQTGPSNPHPETDYIDGVLQVGLREIGMKSAAWSIGRSWVQYHSRLPDTQLWPCVELSPALEEIYPHFAKWQRLCRQVDPLARALDRRGDHGVSLYAWLGMNRHYGLEAHGGVFQSQWIRTHPEFNQVTKDGRQDHSRVEYHFPQVREERIAILSEAAERNPDGIVLGFCRQPPMAGYHPEMVAVYQEVHDVDPRTLDISHGDHFIHWLRWRSQGVTHLLRTLRQRMYALEEQSGARIPVVARIPAGGLFWNLANGMDVETWLHEELIDELLLDPLDDHGPQGSQDVRPYVELGHRHAIPVFGGINLTGANGFHRRFNPVVGLRRLLGLIAANVDGIEVYEAEIFYLAMHTRWLAALWGHPDRAHRFLQESNLEAVYPVTASNALLGHDNHWFYQPSLTGLPGQPLPRGANGFL